MKTKHLKLWSALLLVAGGLTTLACSDDEEQAPQRHLLTVNLTLPAEVGADDVEDLRVIVTDSRGTNDTVSVTGGQSVAVELLQGQYSLTASGKIKDENFSYVSGTGSVALYADATTTIALSKIIQSPLVFKAIYSTGGIAGYVVDQYYEIVNNSDEVQYLDGLIMSAPTGHQTQANAWQAAGITDLYESGQGVVVAFPGSGTDYPLQPGESVVVANDAVNHNEMAPEGNNCPDLSGADWEVYISNVNGEIDYPGADNLDIIFQNNAYMKAFGLGFFGRGYILARCPEGMTPAQFAADPANLQTTPGTTSSTQYLMIPSEYVLDAVDIREPESETYYPTFLAKDDANAIVGSEAWSGRCVRRKVSRIENGRAYYQDTNNSSNDFLNNQPLTPGQTPTQADL